MFSFLSKHFQGEMYNFRIITKRCSLRLGKSVRRVKRGMSLKVICLFESVMSVSFSWLNHNIVLNVNFSCCYYRHFFVTV